MILRIIRFTKKYSLLLGMALTTVVLALNRQLVATLLGDLVDITIEKGIDNTKRWFIYLAIGIIALTFFTWLNNIFIGCYKNISMYLIRSKTIKTIEELPLPKISNYTSGDLVSRMNNDLSFIEKLYGKVIPDTALKAFTGLVAAIYGFYINWRITLIIVLIALVTSIITYVASKPLENKERELQEKKGETSSAFQDTLNGYTEIKAFCGYDILMDKFNSLITSRVSKTYEIAKRECILGSLEVSTSIAIQIGTVFLGLIFILRNEMTIGELVIFQQIQEAIRKIFSVDFISIIKTNSVLKRLYELWDEESEEITGEVINGDDDVPIVNFNKVNFSYQLGKDNLLKNISFNIRKNESVALVGESGCGKSTIAKLICGFYKPISGEIFFKGYNYDKWDKSILRDNISLVDQNTYLFPGTIFDNIACSLYGNHNGKSMDEIKEVVNAAAKQVALTDFISSLEKGYASEVGEWGTKLSGGQRQRLAIARAFVKDADLLILDEPTSALDGATELEIQKTIEKLLVGRTTLIIAHRISTIKNVDRIIVLDAGNIVEEGKHEELLQNRGLYYKLYKQQLDLEAEVACNDKF